MWRIKSPTIYRELPTRAERGACWAVTGIGALAVWLSGHSSETNPPSAQLAERVLGFSIAAIGGERLLEKAVHKIVWKAGGTMQARFPFAVFVPEHTFRQKTFNTPANRIYVVPSIPFRPPTRHLIVDDEVLLAPEQPPPPLPPLPPLPPID